MAQLDQIITQGGATVECACHDSAARIESAGKEFVGQFNGSITARLGKSSVNARGQTNIPLNVIGYSTTSNVPGLGKTTLDFDFDRPVRSSSLRGTDKENFFPGVQSMHVNILMTTEAFPGVTFRSKGPGVLINRNVDNFPPTPGSTYVLQKPVVLEDASGTGKPDVRLVDINTQIVSTQFFPEKIKVTSNLVLHAPKPADRLSEAARPTSSIPIRFTLQNAGRTSVKVLNARGQEVATLVDKQLEPGTHSVDFEPSRFRGKEYSYQIQIDGRNHSARMPLR